MLTAILLQLASVAILVPAAWLFNDATSAFYLFLGAATAILPNALFALRLRLNRGKSPESYPVVFFLGEFMKLGLTLGLFMAVVSYGNAQQEPVRWLALLIGLIVALKMPLFALALHRDKPLETAPEKPLEPQARKVPVRLNPYHPADARNT